MEVRNFAIIFSVTAVLAACGGSSDSSESSESSDGYIKKVLVKEGIKLAEAGLAAYSGPSDADYREAVKLNDPSVSKENLDKMRIVNCKTAEAGGYQCDMTGGNGSATSIRMIKVDDKWAIVR